MSDGRSGISHSTSGMSASVAMPIAVTGDFQLPCSSSCASSGRKMSVPVAMLAVRMPMTRPRSFTNQRLTMVAASTMAMQPVPMPDSTPQVRMSCQDSVMNRLRNADSDIRPSASASVRRTPKLCISAAANGPMRP